MRTRLQLILISVLLISGSLTAAAQMEHASTASLPQQISNAGKNSTVMAAQQANSSALDESKDHQAKIVNFKGDVRILKKDSGKWTAVQKDMIVTVGDQILTSKASSVDIVYDHYYLNLSHIDENTKAEFKSIEPTVIDLEDGTIFNSLDGLKKGDQYEIATPTAVAAVRGTHFEVSYGAAAGDLSLFVFPVDDHHESKVALLDLDSAGKKGKELEVVEGKQIHLEPNQIPAPELAKVIEPEKVESANAIFEDFSKEVANFDELRKEGETHLVQENASQSEMDKTVEQLEQSKPADKKTDSENKDKEDPEKKEEDSQKKVLEPPHDGGNGGDAESVQPKGDLPSPPVKEAPSSDAAVDSLADHMLMPQEESTSVKQEIDSLKKSETGQDIAKSSEAVPSIPDKNTIVADTIAADKNPVVDHNIADNNIANLPDHTIPPGTDLSFVDANGDVTHSAAEDTKPIPDLGKNEEPPSQPEQQAKS